MRLIIATGFTLLAYSFGFEALSPDYPGYAQILDRSFAYIFIRFQTEPISAFILWSVSSIGVDALYGMTLFILLYLYMRASSFCVTPLKLILFTAAIPILYVSWIVPRQCLATIIILYLSDRGSFSAKILPVLTHNFTGLSNLVATVIPTIAKFSSDKLLKTMTTTVLLLVIVLFTPSLEDYYVTIYGKLETYFEWDGRNTGKLRALYILIVYGICFLIFLNAGQVSNMLNITFLTIILIYFFPIFPDSVRVHYVAVLLMLIRISSKIKYP